MWIRLKGKWRHWIVTQLVREPRVTVFTPSTEFASYIHFDHESKRRAFVVWLVDQGIRYDNVKQPPLD